MDTITRLAALIAECMKSRWPEAEGLPSAEELRGLLAVPPDPALGDYAFPCFRLAKSLRMAPPKIAEELCAAWTQESTASVRPVNGYMNFFLNRANFAAETMAALLAAGDRYGASDLGAGKTICLDYSSINIAKRFHIGHLSTTMIGHSLKRIYDFLGYTTVGINHLGDWGTQFGKMICAYKKWGSREDVEARGIDAMTELYVRFHKEAEENPALEDEGRAWFKKIEDGDPEAMEIFTWFKDVTLRDAAKVYDTLGVTFDSYAGESFYIDKMEPVIQELRDKGLLVQSQGAWVVDLEEDHMPPCLIIKSDGATIYATRDLAAAIYRQNTYHFDKCLYVVAYQQDLHFRQIFRVLEKMGYPWAKDCVHVAFGMISFEGEALSTRKGNVVHLEDLLDQAVVKAREIIEEKSPNLENKDEVARQVGIGAVVYTDLSANRIKDIDFRWDRALNFDGESGPYVQYTHARCCSVLRKAGSLADVTPDWSALTDDEAQALLRLLSRFPEVIREAAEKYEPSMITRAVTDIAQAFNKYYYEHRILDGEPAGAAARVALTDAARSVIRTGLYLIGIEAPERM
ncbi:MAG: arginine--tRNA ligase [Clostridia bacterium]|nr:arginine--tRNA ligase [Clostridia bacterium]